MKMLLEPDKCGADKKFGVKRKLRVVTRETITWEQLYLNYMYLHAGPASNMQDGEYHFAAPIRRISATLPMAVMQL